MEKRCAGGKGSTNALLEIRRIRENEEEGVAERNWRTVEAGEKKRAKEIYARISNGTPAFFPFLGSQNHPIEVNSCVSTCHPPLPCLTWQQ